MVLYKDAPLINARHRRDKGIGTGRQHHRVIGKFNPFIGTDAVRLALNLTGSIADMGDAVLLVPLPLRQHQPFRATVCEERRQTNTVIGGTRLFTEGDDSVLARHIMLHFSQKRCPTMPLPMTTTVFCRLDPFLAPLIALSFHSTRVSVIPLM